MLRDGLRIFVCTEPQDMRRSFDRLSVEAKRATGFDPLDGRAMFVFINKRCTHLASCQMHDINPWQYLRDILCLLPSWQLKNLIELAPCYWPQTGKKPLVREQLEQNPFRKVTLTN